MELTKTKKRLSTATRGHKLLKDKQDEMARQFMFYIRRNRELRQEIEALLSKAMGEMALAEAEMGTASLEEALLVSASGEKPDSGVKNIMSVNVPDIQPMEAQVGSLPYGFAFTSADLDYAVASLSDILPDLMRLAEIEKSCQLMAAEIEKTRRRVNALEHVTIPETQAGIKYITMKLDENERSTQIRLMKVKDMMLEEAHHYSEK
jgi:V/A-type H+-transporting ATPase subunit D